MNKLPGIKPRKLLQILKKNSFYIHHQRGSHIVLKHNTDRSKRVTLPLHNKDLKRKTLISILHQSGLDRTVLSKT